MKETIKNTFKHPNFYICITLIIFRLILGWYIGIQYYSSEFYDDALLMNYADFSTHFQNPNYLSLVKTMSYPLFLNIVHLSKIPYSLFVSGIWVIDGLYMKNFLKNISKKEWISMIGFLYVAYFPTAFEIWQGTRVYRNSIIAPFVIFIFIYLLNFTYKNITNKISFLDCIKALGFGVIFTFTYYIKEDGLWLLACLLFAILANILIRVFIRKLPKIKRIKGMIIVLCFSLIIISVFGGLTTQYKALNKKYFGVSEVETRNGGELGKFAANVYKISSLNRNQNYWAPKDAIDKAWDNSPTLQKYPQLYEAIIHTPWYGDIESNPIRGDFLTWVLRTALIDTNIWTNESEVSDLFGKVNIELEEAFKNGQLEEDNRIQLLSSAGGRTISQILSLYRLMGKAFLGAVFLKDYVPAIQTVGNTDNEEVAQKAAELTNTNYLLDYSKKPISNIVNSVIKGIYWLYRIVNGILLINCLISIIWAFIKIIKKIIKHIRIDKVAVYLQFSSFVCLGIGLAYSLAISWFSEFIFLDGYNPVILNFYMVGLPAVLTFSYFLSFVYTMNYLVRRKTT
ncbi:hypothetical protein [uncultured Dubosiella sp.]|uniref:hypothetical protein n=3 Tax=uncultured Dubosiella sp. TaxID=1937011 RepID=UPI0025F527C3|nr:hypothetical protein [uncultured Dubosiella sp.]